MTRPAFTDLARHVDDPERRRRLAEIESRLIEHPFPPQLVIENTSYCNMRCIHCCHKEMIRPQRHMSDALWRKIVEEVGRESPECEVWPTFYGEALILGETLWERLEYAAGVGCRNLVLNSNGTLLGRGENITRVLSSPLRRFILSLDGLTKETFEAIRAKGRYSEVIPAVEELLRRKQESGRQHPVVIAQFSVMKENAHEAQAFAAFWRERGAEVKLRPMLEWTASGSVRSGTIVHDTSFRIECPWGNSTMAVHQDGSVVACAVDYEGHFKAANLNEVSVREAWMILGRALRSPQRRHEWSEVPRVCKGCGDWQAAGASYDEETVSGSRPFWYYDERSPGNK